ncbi:MAG: DUF2155 domain-containing protein [Parvibaculum sp.]
MMRALLVIALLSIGGLSPALAEPAGRIAIFTGLDKITARITRLEVPIGERMRFGSLDVKADSCSKRPPEETPETTAFVEVFDVGQSLVDAAPAEPLTTDPATNPAIDEAAGRIFSGWMFASSPGLNAVEHPVYDVWLIDCKMSEPETVAPSE